jgi:hypothetical protein
MKKWNKKIMKKLLIGLFIIILIIIICVCFCWRTKSNFKIGKSICKGIYDELNKRSEYIKSQLQGPIVGIKSSVSDNNIIEITYKLSKTSGSFILDDKPVIYNYNSTFASLQNTNSTWEKAILTTGTNSDTRFEIQFNEFKYKLFDIQNFILTEFTISGLQNIKFSILNDNCKITTNKENNICIQLNMHITCTSLLIDLLCKAYIKAIFKNILQDNLQLMCSIDSTANIIACFDTTNNELQLQTINYTTDKPFMNNLNIDSTNFTTQGGLFKFIPDLSKQILNFLNANINDFLSKNPLLTYTFSNLNIYILRNFYENMCSTIKDQFKKYNDMIRNNIITTGNFINQKYLLDNNAFKIPIISV